MGFKVKVLVTINEDDPEDYSIRVFAGPSMDERSTKAFLKAVETEVGCVVELIEKEVE